MTYTQRNMIQRESKREKEREREREKKRERVYFPTVIILRVPSIKIPDFFAQHRPAYRKIILLSLIMTQNYQEKL